MCSLKDGQALLNACRDGHYDVVVMLISKGADINHVDEVSDTSCFIVQIKCVVTESSYMHFTCTCLLTFTCSC